MAITSKSTMGSLPQHSQPLEGPGIPALFHSLREQALILDKTVSPGYGILKAGTLMSKAADGNFFPYPTVDGTNVAFRALSIGDMGSTATFIDILKVGVGRFKVGDIVRLVRNDSGVLTTHDGGAITAIAVDQTGYSSRVTFTTALDTDANFTVANLAGIILEASTDASGVNADMIMDKDVDTGEGVGSLGAHASFVVSNAILYLGVLANADAAGIIDLGAVNDDPYLILK